MDLMAKIDAGLSWRRFWVLLGNLGPNSVVVNTLAYSGEESEPLEGEQVADFLRGW